MNSFCFIFLALTDIFASSYYYANISTDYFMNIGYDLSAPDRIYELPGKLKEISGITETGYASIACIQDEYETIYIYDINKGEIVRQFSSGGNGDFEGIARVGRTLYLLRSDGLLVEIADYESEKFKRTVFLTGVQWRDNEGLCYDQKNNQLLIAPKETPGKDSENKEKRFIYGFNLSTKKLIKEPLFEFDLSVIKKFALENKIYVPVKGNKHGQKEGPDIKLRISAIGIHPITGRLFVLSGIERLLMVFDMDGEIVFMEKLGSDLFAQPEGITFMKNGDMYISNEGKKNQATLVRFNYEPTMKKP